MPSPSTAANPDQLPPSTRNQAAPSAPGDPSGFSILEWNALTNRAKAILQALSACRQAGEEDSACRYCSLAGGDAERGEPAPEEECRARFRVTQRQLFRLAHRVGGPERHQLQRTVASLHLAYRNIDQGKDGR